MRQLKITNKITNRESVALEKYLNDIAKIDLITAEINSNIMHTKIQMKLEYASV